MRKRTKRWESTRERTVSFASVILALSLFGLVCTALADNYSNLAAQGYRWVTADGPYACTTEQDVQRMVGHHTDATELQVVENIRSYYLIPETTVKVIRRNQTRARSKL